MFLVLTELVGFGVTAGVTVAHANGIATGVGALSAFFLVLIVRGVSSIKKWETLEYLTNKEPFAASPHVTEARTRCSISDTDARASQINEVMTRALNSGHRHDDITGYAVKPMSSLRSLREAYVVEHLHVEAVRWENQFNGIVAAMGTTAGIATVMARDPPELRTSGNELLKKLSNYHDVAAEFLARTIQERMLTLDNMEKAFMLSQIDEAVSGISPLEGSRASTKISGLGLTVGFPVEEVSARIEHLQHELDRISAESEFEG